MGKQRITVFTTATALTVPDGAKYAILTSNENIRFWANGDTPTTSQGHEIFAGDFHKLSASEGLNTALFIAETTAAVLEVSYFNFQS